jgi:hypothetical protein
MTPRDVLHAAVFFRRFVQTDPAGEVIERLRARPIRVILMPRHDPAVPGRLAKELVVPEANAPSQQL